MITPLTDRRPHLKVSENPGLIRDSHSKSIINVDNESLNAYKKQRLLLSNAKKSSEKVLKLESQIEEMREMLLTLMKNKE